MLDCSVLNYQIVVKFRKCFCDIISFFGMTTYTRTKNISTARELRNRNKYFNHLIFRRYIIKQLGKVVLLFYNIVYVYAKLFSKYKNSIIYMRVCT